MYSTNTTLRFRGADGKQQEIPEGTAVSFEKGDQVDIAFLLSVGAIVEMIEPGGGHGRKARQGN